MTKQNSENTQRRYPLDKLGLKARDFSRNAVKVADSLVEAGYEAYIVGGAVRDLLLGLHPKDFDVATNATPEQIKRVFRRSRIIGRRFRIVHVYMRDELIEVTTFRAPSLHDSNKHQQADASGRLLRDNVYGSLEDDVWRRDFTVNALYYDSTNKEILDFCDALSDIRNKRLSLMGDPLTRYQEDPVRLLRAVRFKSKLGFELETNTKKPLHTHGHLLGNIPAARLFDEVLKMFIKGHGAAVYKDLREYDLFEHLFPATNPLVVSNHLHAHDVIKQAMLNTDERVAIGKNVSPVFFFAIMLWAPIEKLAGKYLQSGATAINAWTQAALEIFSAQQSVISVPRRIGIPAQNVVIMQARFQYMHGRRVFWLMQQPRFRAGYDLMLLRVQFGLEKPEVAEWWTNIQTLDRDAQEDLAYKSRSGGKKSGKRKRRRRPRKKPSAS
ncbi:MAG: polynucleotide adenylyltransferase PcnB [Gammaproteobacteria bacterium]|nr:polynucleotide adenylyltransferase PcnB [Gammaproteobacteria bacterium]